MDEVVLSTTAMMMRTTTVVMMMAMMVLNMIFIPPLINRGKNAFCAPRHEKSSFLSGKELIY
jgi:hypothetical protein